MRLKASLAGFAAMLAVCISGTVQAQNSVATDRAAQLFAANNLVVPDSLPFHLKMDFQLFDLNGMSEAKGTVEEWWASKDSKKVTIKAPWLKEDGTVLKSDDPEAVRGEYLVNLLIGAVEDPVPSRTLPEAVTTNMTVGKMVLNCIGPKAAVPNGLMARLATLCTEPGRDAVRYLSMSSGMEVVVRNSIGTFRSKYVGVDVTVLFAGHPAISAKVSTLEGLDPATVGMTTDSSPKTVPPTEPVAGLPDASASSKPPVTRARISGGVSAGFRTKYVQPEYPAEAKAARLSGLVLLRAVIAKDGTIQNLIPLVSSNSIFTKPAMEAVRQWAYKPYLLNGQPVEVDTDITVNFRLN